MTELTENIYQTLSSSGPPTKTGADVVADHLGKVIGRSEAMAAFEARTKNRPMLLDNPQKESRARLERKAVMERQKDDRSRTKRNRERRRERRLSRDTAGDLKYQTFLDIHTLWTEYMSELLNLHNLSSVVGPLDEHVASHAMGMQTKLVKADFHGCKLTVKASKCPTLVGSSGIVIEETANIFRVITCENKVKVLPKQNSIFIFTIPLRSNQDDTRQIQFELYGNQFRFRADDRASRKFKSKETIAL